ncbi:MAG: hypothetical protein C0407_01710, partial [Desulfobacca sp.]|nr:hypothetical protein [Desulfobacca sp.]
MSIFFYHRPRSWPLFSDFKIKITLKSRLNVTKLTPFPVRYNLPTKNKPKVERNNDWLLALMFCLEPSLGEVAGLDRNTQHLRQDQ